MNFVADGQSLLCGRFFIQFHFIIYLFLYDIMQAAFSKGIFAYFPIGSLIAAWSLLLHAVFFSCLAVFLVMRVGVR